MKNSENKTIDINFDFTTDTPHYWENFWNNNNLGGSKYDPDLLSKKLQQYHQLLWSKNFQMENLWIYP